MMLLKNKSKNYVKSLQQTLFFDAYAYLKNISCNQLTVRNRLIIISRNFATSAVWKLWKFTVTHLWQKFRENKVFTKEVTKELI